MKYFTKTIFIIIIFSLLALPQASIAAEVFTSSPAKVFDGETFEVTINAATDGNLINSINIVLNHDENLVSFAGYKSDGSIVNLWLHSPYEKDGSVYLEGIIPGGVSGLYDPRKENPSPIPLVKLLFKAKDTGDARFSFTKTEILKHDGNGTILTHSMLGSNTNIVDRPQTEQIDIKQDILDKVPPEAFEITFLDSSALSRTPDMIAFQAFDRDSGIREYQINTGSFIWENTESPQAVSKGFFPRSITVRAIDFYDNYTDASITIPGIVSIQLLIISLICLFLFCIIGYRVIKYKR